MKPQQMTREQLEKLPTSEILELYNQATGRATKKFNTRGKGIELTFKALQSSQPDGSSGKTPKELEDLFKSKPKPEKKARRSSGMSFRLAPRDWSKTPRSGTKRAQVFEMVSKPEGALFSDIQKKCKWDIKDAYEGVRLLNVFCGLGLWHENVEGGDYRIWQVDADTFAVNVQRANAEA